MIALLVALAMALPTPCNANDVECLQRSLLTVATENGHLTNALTASEQLNKALTADKEKLSQQLQKQPVSHSSTWFIVGFIGGAIVTGFIVDKTVK